jgi:ABC-type lipoprotein export system ATPase subunit
MATSEIKLSKKIKTELYRLLRKDQNAISEFDEDGIIPFLQAICDLSSMKSEDTRYNNALGDFVQHLVRNDDYSYDYVFEERLNILNDDDLFNKFIEAIVAPEFRKDEDEIMKYVLLISPYVEKDEVELSVSDYSDIGTPIYKLSKKTAEDRPVDIGENPIPFYVDKNPSGRNDWADTHRRPLSYPSFVLSANNGWNDYSIFSYYHLFYYESEGQAPINIGPVKIINSDKGESLLTNDYLHDQFRKLSSSFCSLGQSFTYYNNLKDLFGSTKTFEILYALRDVAFFPAIQEEFEKHSHYKQSLIRFDEAERLVREARYLFFDYDLSNLYSFKYLFQPKYSSEQIEVNFEFDNKRPLPNRIYAMIGKNGTGKTQLITSLPLSISKKEDQSFLPRTPLFSRIIAVSYSYFDQFEIPRKTSTFNYHYCGIRKNEDENYTASGLAMRFRSTLKKLEELQRIPKWRKILTTFMENELLDTFIKGDDIFDDYTVDIEGYNSIKNKLSSGQAIVLYIITEIVANIRYDSLLLYDEPETHLHPNAITQLMNTIYELTEEFQSYCIIATHSPLVVRELLSRNVYIIDRDEDNPSIRRIASESFGENLGSLTEEIFGNKGIPKLHTKILKRLVSQGSSFEDIVSMLECDEMPLSLNARIFIQSLVNERERVLQ